MNAPAHELPIEIWEQIISYLPNTFTTTLYAINSPLLHLALNLRYRVATIDGRAIERTLLSSNARGRARKVVINTNHHSCFDPACSVVHSFKQDKNLLERIIRLFLLGKHLFSMKGRSAANGGGPVKTDTYYNQLMQATQGLKHVQEVELRSIFVQEQHYLSKLKFTKALLGASLDHISRLSLSCLLEDLHHALNADVVFPRLSTIRLTFRTFYTSSDTTEPLGKLHKLLCNHQSTIQDLELSFSYMINPSVFLQDLPKFPVLWRFILNQHILSLDQSSFAGTTYFVSQHRAQIRSLSLFILPHPFIHTFPHELMFNTAASATFAQFSNLNELTLGIVPRPFLPINIRTYLEWYKPTLTSLQLHSNIWTYTQLRDILSSVTLRLRRLAMEVACLSPQLLEIFARRLPDLESLVLTVELGVSSNPHTQNHYDLPGQPLFSDGVPEVLETLREWNLKSFALFCYMSFQSISRTDRAAIVSALPRVQYFCEVGPVEYASSGPDPGCRLMESKDFWGIQYRDKDDT